MVVRSSGFAAVQAMVKAGYAGGAWTGPGITTSIADAATGLTSLGIATADQLGKVGGTFGGETLATGDAIVMYTYAGDANLDGFISGDDYTANDFAIAVPGASGWFNGDFNHDGIVSGDDYTVIDFNVVAQGAPFPTDAAGGIEGVTAVPEPGGILFVSSAAAAAMLRRRRRHA